MTRRKKRSLGEDLVDPKTRDEAAAEIRRIARLLGHDPAETEREIARRIAAAGARKAEP